MAFTYSTNRNLQLYIMAGLASLFVQITAAVSASGALDKAQIQRSKAVAASKAGSPSSIAASGHLRRTIDRDNLNKRVYRQWYAQNFASSPEEVSELTSREARIFEEGHRMKKRKEQFYQRLSACQNGDYQCERRVIAQQVRADRELRRRERTPSALSKAADATVLVTDDMGRTIPLLVIPEAAAAPSRISSWFAWLTR
eukprot:TRINITY_DN3407_c0_g2_i1.p1 TRINITY_DN3407_c0_g2~~TRINITY_DN3407_c0_g2_i1.p1  ORF type:complete len:213 (-),score=23.53 TRINITY_DN3407_c0_g2_i1:61-657(-)